MHNKNALHYSPLSLFHPLLIAFGVFLLLQGLIAENCRQWPLLYKCVKYADEVFVLLGLLFVMSSRLIKRQIPQRAGIEWPLSLFLLIGIISSLAAQVPLSIAGVQFFLYIKGFLLLYIFANLPMNEMILRRYTRFFFYVALAILALGVIGFAAPGWFRDITGNTAHIDYRAGIPSVKSLFIHPGLFGWFMSFIALFILAFFFTSGDLRYFFLSIVFSYGAFYSMRRKAILGLMVGAAGFGLFKKLLNKRNILFIALFCLVVIVPNYDKINYLYSKMIKNYGADYVKLKERKPYKERKPDKAARNALYFTSLKIAKDYFPLGAGFGRYGSWMSRVHYSPLYDEYGLSEVRGLSREGRDFINDTFWPMVLGETGFIGIALYAAIFVLLIKGLYKQIRNAKHKYVKAFQLGTFMVLIESLVESIAQPVYVAPPIVYFIFGSVGISYSLMRKQETIPEEI